MRRDTDVSAFGAAMIARKLVETDVDLTEIARQWSLSAAERVFRAGARKNTATCSMITLFRWIVTPCLSASHEFPYRCTMFGRYTDVDRAFWREHLDPWLPRRIFDAHTHVFERVFVLRAMSEEKRRQYWVNEVLEPIGATEAQRCHDLVFPGREILLPLLRIGEPRFRHWKARTPTFKPSACNGDGIDCPT